MGTAGQSITLANSIIGVGILAMPFCFQQCGVLLATLILLSMGLISRLCCYFLLKSALLARRRNFEFLAFYVFGSAGKLAVEVGIIGFLMGTCIAYFVVVGDLGPQIIAKLFNINQSDILRTSIMVIVSLVCVLPLGLLRNVDSLSNVSAATIGFYFCLVMKVIAEAASHLWTGEWHTRMELWKPSGVLQCVPIFSMALFCQTQLFEIFESLPTLSLEKMNVVTKNALNICTGVYFTLGVFGYIAFCSQQISGNILMSLSPTLASDVIKLGFVMSLAFSFPLIIFPCRASLYSLLYKKVHSSHHDHIINHSIPESSFRCITVAIIAVTLFISLLIPNIELVLGLVGSTIGVLICIVFPAACFIHLTFKNTNERVLAKVILGFGLIVMILGTYANLEAAESQKDKYDDRYITQERIDKLVEDFFEKMDKADGEKPMVNDPPSNEIKINENILIESEIQPPNPVPPESQSNEKPQKQVEVNLDSKPNVLAAPDKEAIDKVSETHPKNLNRLNDAKANDTENNMEKNKLEKLKEEKAKTASNEENMKKQQQLIETIKQHGEEQKELIKEQKEILDEIMKTKEEQKKENKNEADSLAAKIIAVESIKKIADMAIQSLSGVSEKPVGQDVEDTKAEHIEELADKAVQEIAKKAVETIEAIKEINVNADASIPKLDNQPVESNPLPSASGSIQNNAEIKSNVPPSNTNIHPPVSQTVDKNLPVVPSAVNAQAEAVALNNAAVENKAPSVNNNGQSIQSTINQPVENVPQRVLSVQEKPMNVQDPAQSVQQSPVNVPQPSANIDKSAANAQQIAAKIQQSAANVQQSAGNAQQPVADVHRPAANVQQPVANLQQPVKVQQPSVTIQKPVNQPVVQQSAANVNQQVVNNQPPVVNVHEPAVYIQHASDNVKQPIVNLPKINAAQNNLPKQPVKNVVPEINGINKIPTNNQPDAIQIKDNMIKNVPLPLAKDNMNQQNGNAPMQESLKSNNDNKKDNNGAVDNDIHNGGLNRQKREVVDCTEKTTLKPEDKQICEKLVNVPRIKTNVKDDFPKIDLNDIALPKSLPMDVNLIHHLRSLKSYDVNDKDR